MLKPRRVAAMLCVLPGLGFADGHVTGDAAAGEKVFRKCRACHEVGAEAVNKVGPALNGVVDSAVAADDSFKYSKVLMALGAEGKTWTPEDLDTFLTKPRTYAKGTKMSFAGLRKDEDRLNIIAYLASFPGDDSGS